ncbi:MAG: hypothetical protein KGK07_17510, partial [Chloroflexota bacterium]|nr:hypothetical protein [Chloroflexota bacterium]
MGDLASRFDVDPPVRVARTRRPAAAVPTTAALVEAAAARAGAQEAQWETLPSRRGRRCAEAALQILDVAHTNSGLRLNSAAMRGFGV